MPQSEDPRMPEAQPSLMSFVRKLETHSSLSAKDHEAILSLPHDVREVGPNSYILRESDRPTSCAILLSGLAVRHKFSGTGARQILSVHLAGNALDLQNLLLEESDHNIQSLGHADVAFVPRQAVLDLAARYPAVGRAFWRDTLIDASVFREWIVNVGRRDARSRLAHLFCELAVRKMLTGGYKEGPYEIPLTQEQLGDATGLTPVHVNRVLKSLGPAGGIRRSKGSAIVEDFKRCAQLGDFDPRYLWIDDNGGLLSLTSSVPA